MTHSNLTAHLQYFFYVHPAPPGIRDILNDVSSTWLPCSDLSHTPSDTPTPQLVILLSLALLEKAFKWFTMSPFFVIKL